MNLPTELVTIFRRLYFVDEMLTSLANRTSLGNNALSSSDFLKTTWEVQHRGGWAKWPCPHFDNTITQILTIHIHTSHGSIQYTDLNNTHFRTIHIPLQLHGSIQNTDLYNTQFRFIQYTYNVHLIQHTCTSVPRTQKCVTTFVQFLVWYLLTFALWQCCVH